MFKSFLILFISLYEEKFISFKALLASSLALIKIFLASIFALFIKFLSKSKNSKPTQKIAYNFNSFSKSKNINTEINVIGETVSDAVLLIDKFLDDCSLAKLSTVRIIHGKGTGKLKNGIHTFLKTNPHVKSFRMGTFGEGEMGVTVVELK